MCARCFCTVFCLNALLICVGWAFGAVPPPPSRSSVEARQQVLQSSLKKEKHSQSWSELKTTFLLLPRHSISHCVFVCTPAACQDHTTDTLSIKMSKWGNGSSSTLQGWLTTANRTYRSMSVAQSQPSSCQGQLVRTELHVTMLGHLPCLVLPVQGQTSTRSTHLHDSGSVALTYIWVWSLKPLFLLLRSLRCPRSRTWKCFSASMTWSAHTCLTAWWDEMWPWASTRPHTLVFPQGWKEP